MNFNIVSFFIGIILVAFLIILALAFIAPQLPIPDHDIAYDKCCGGMQCSDTYYDYQRDVCVLTMCQNSTFTNKGDCESKPK